MKWYEKVVTCKVTWNSMLNEYEVKKEDYIIHPQKDIKVKYSKIDKSNNNINYTIPKEIEERLNKSIQIRKLFNKANSQELEDNYLRGIIACRNFLNTGMKFFKELEKIQTNKKETKQWKIKENLKLEIK